MTCPLCGCETLRVMASVQRTAQVDLRTVQCVSCSQQFWTETRIAEAIVFDRQTLSRRNVPIAEFLSRWIQRFTGEAA